MVKSLQNRCLLLAHVNCCAPWLRQAVCQEPATTSPSRKHRGKLEISIPLLGETRLEVPLDCNSLQRCQPGQEPVVLTEGAEAEAAFRHCPAPPTGFVEMPLCPWTSTRTHSHRWAPVLKPSASCGEEPRSAKSSFASAGLRLCFPTGSSSAMTGSLFSEQLWWILEESFPCRKPFPLGVAALYVWFAFKRESRYTVLFFFNALFQNDALLKHKLRNFFAQVWTSPCLTTWGKEAWNVSATAAILRLIGRTLFDYVSYRALQSTANL